MCLVNAKRQCACQCLGPSASRLIREAMEEQLLEAILEAVAGAHDLGSQASAALGGQSVALE